MRQRDIVEHRLVRRLRQQPDSRSALFVRARRQLQRADGFHCRLRFGAQHRQVFHESLDETRIERFTRFLPQQTDRALVAHRLVIGALGGERVEVVDDGEDPRAGGNFFALHAGRIALAIPTFVVAQNERRDRIGERNTSNDLGPDLRMNSNFLEFFLRERARLRKNVLGYRQLADVVQERRSFHALDLALGHPDAFRKARGKDLHPTDVRLAGAILRVDRQRQRFNSREVQIRDFLHVTLLVLDAAQIDLVAAIGEIQRRRGEHRDPVVRRPADHDRNTRGRRRAHEVARRTPEEILIPDAQHRLVRRQRNRGRDQRRVAHENTRLPRRSAVLPWRSATSTPGRGCRRGRETPRPPPAR